jgi:hypothetical protein
VKFLNDRNATSCTRVTTLANCATALAASTFASKVFISTGTSTTATINGAYFVVDNANTVTTATTFPTIALATTGAGATSTCICTNVPKELHYRAITTGGNTITNVTLNGAFVTISGLCNSVLSIDQIYSFVFKDTTLSRVQSGSPGYHKGLPVLAGYINTATNAGIILAREQGFPLYGADTSGTCLGLTSATVSPTAYKYFDDPVLTFADGAIYGCKLSFTLAQLQTF